MKTVFINCSPKKHFCASAYFIFLQRLFVGGKKVTEKLRTPTDHDRILVQLDDAQNVVFSLPLYVDGVPSHVLRFMEKMETYCKEKDLKLSVYCLANNGFIEGRQNEPLMQIFENFCSRAGLNWGGGIGVGGGVMLNVYRIVYVVQFCFLLLNIILNAINTGSFYDKGALTVFRNDTAIILFLNLGVLFYIARMGHFIRKSTFSGKKYTRIMVPSFLFILFADLFFIIVSLIKGGLFRGWLAKKQPTCNQTSLIEGEVQI